MLVVLDRKNLEAAIELVKNLGKARVHVPRPLPAEVFEEIDEYVEKYYMPPSTLARLSRRAKEIVKGRVELLSRRGRFADIDLETVTQIIALYRAGSSVREIAGELNIPKSTVHYIIHREQKIRDGDVKILVQ
ncbi:MAG: N-terminal DNA-binding domain [Candidatus Diapherotrites archaeon]|nr:N-terminal DNA-binding domain [Candidatus Diapherotrites archaeon]